MEAIDVWNGFLRLWAWAFMIVLVAGTAGILFTIAKEMREEIGTSGCVVWLILAAIFFFGIIGLAKVGLW